MYEKCHEGFYKIADHLFVGKKSQLSQEIIDEFSLDVLVPLDSLDGEIWDLGYRGEILYLPIIDFGTLPKDVEKIYAKKIASLLYQGKNVAMFCIGGHGRTGYMSSLVLLELGIKSPIELIRNSYCKHAVETEEQRKAIENYLK
jgi:protein-tyrosine phosphatase